jgi:hypothetical protein
MKRNFQVLIGFHKKLQLFLWPLHGEWSNESKLVNELSVIFFFKSTMKFEYLKDCMDQ